MQGNVHWFLSVHCVRMSVCVCVSLSLGEERGQDAGCSKSRKGVSYGALKLDLLEKPKTIVLLKGLRPKN